MNELMEFLKDYDCAKMRDGLCRGEFIELPSVGSGLEKTELMIHPQFTDGDYDMDVYVELEEIDDKYWLSELSREDEQKIINHLKSLL